MIGRMNRLQRLTAIAFSLGVREREEGSKFTCCFFSTVVLRYGRRTASLSSSGVSRISDQSNMRIYNISIIIEHPSSGLDAPNRERRPATGRD